MPLAPATRLGHYEISELIGSGGMGEVYRARDTRLDRIVAIKVLPEAPHPALRRRIEDEARLVAGISHPHICALFDVGREGQIGYFVMEYLEGETLAGRLGRGPLALDLVLRWGAQVAAALAAAHRHGVVHRDLKPGNIMLTHGDAKLLDFGLAKLRENGPGMLAALVPTDAVTAEWSTLRGIGAGTLNYMAPEQLRGLAVDARADIFALGGVLYEMVTGRRPFEGDSQASLIAAILDSDPPAFESLPLRHRQVPASLEHLTRTCLAKDPDDRWQSAQDVARELTAIAEGRAPGGVARIRPMRSRWLAWLIAGGATATLLGTGWILRSRWASETPPPLVRFHVAPQPPANLATGESEVRVSPDGRHVAFIARHRGRTMLWVRSVDAVGSRPIAGTDGASQPFWSPDNRSIGFHAEGAIKRVPFEGGSVQILCPLRTMAGATWSPRGVILFSQLNTLGLVPDTGGTPKSLPSTQTGQADTVHIWPQFLSDGDHYLFRVVRGPRGAQGLFAGSLNSQNVWRVLDTTTNVVPADKYLLFVRAGALMAQPFDFRRWRTTGEPEPVADQVMENLGELSGPSFSVSRTGVLAYRVQDVFPTTLTWFHRTGRPLETLSAPAGCRNPEISPDGRLVAVECLDTAANSRDVWVLNATPGRPIRLTTDASDDSDPVWSPDGQWIVFASGRNVGGGRDLYRRAASGAGQDESMLRSPRTKYPTGWSHDGRFIIFTSREENTGWDIWMVPLGGAPVPVVSTPAVEIEPQLSPDGRWLAYTSNESGRMDVYVRPFRAEGGTWLVSTAGGSDPRWRDDGSELYYLSSDRVLMVVSVKTGARFEASVPQALFQTRTSGPLGLGVRFNYAVAPGGLRFLITADVPESMPSPITVVLNWTRNR